MENKKLKNNKMFLGQMLVLALIVTVIFLMFVLSCGFMPGWLIALILLDYFILLLINYLISLKRKINGWVFAVLLALMPIMVVLFCGAWAWWIWLIVIILYLITLVTYFFGVLAEEGWYLVAPLSLFLLLMLYLLQICSC